MSLIHLFLVAICTSVVTFLFLSVNNQTTKTTSDFFKQSSPNIAKLIQLIHAQNETIYALERHLNAKHGDPSHMSREYSNLVEMSNNVHSVHQESLIDKIEVKNTKSSVSNPWASLQTTLEKDCELKFGMTLVDSWNSQRQVWCESSVTDEVQSELVCYPYHQAHKKLDGRGPDMFCEASNFLIDFSKIKGEHSTDHKPSLGNQYLSFEKGSLSAGCKLTSSYRSNLFMPHNSAQMRSFESGKMLSAGAYATVSTPTYLLARDEDCENSFHSTADFMNMFLVGAVLRLSFEDVQVMLLDKHPDGPYLDLIKKAFSPSHEVVRHQHYKGQKVLFKKLIFHLESPAGLIFPKVSRPDPLRCYDTSLFNAYRRHVLQAFNLLDVPPPAIPTITLSLRHRTPQKNVGRVMANEEDVKAVLRKGNLININVEDTAKLSYYEQLKLARSTNILVGVHGAGLMFIMFAAEESKQAILVEIHPSYRQDRHFRHAARMTGKIYMPVRSQVRESCVGSSDSVTVPIDEFERTIDGAVRIARSFDDGLSECGLVCPLQILAMDGRLDDQYKGAERKSRPINTQFPCG